MQCLFLLLNNLVLVQSLHIFHFHTRKAGGTTLRRWLNQIGTTRSVEGYNFDPQTVKKGAIMVTSIRNPVDRLWSSYKYEGRWDLRAPNFTDHGTSFASWLEKTSSNICGRFTWQCSENCYTRWFSGCTSGSIHNYFAVARQNLELFDVVINVHQLHNENYVDTLMRCLNTTIRPTHKLPWMGIESMKANKNDPVYLSDRVSLDYLNALDHALLIPFWNRPPCKL